MQTVNKNRVQLAMEQGRDVVGMRMLLTGYGWPSCGNKAFTAVRVVGVNNRLPGIVVSPVHGFGMCLVSFERLVDPTAPARRRCWIAARGYAWSRDLLRPRHIEERRKLMLSNAIREDLLSITDDWQRHSRRPWRFITARELRAVADSLGRALARREWAAGWADRPDIEDTVVLSRL